MNAKKMIGAMLAASTILSMPAIADVATLTATVSGNDLAVSVPSGVLDDTSKLYLVWDSEDHGGKLADWPAENRIAYDGAITSSSATYTFDKSSIPVGSMMRAIATSDVRLIDGYVKLGADQYVNTGVSATRAYGLNIKYRYVGTLTGSYYASLMGGVLDADFTIGRYVYKGADSFYFKWHGAVDVPTISGLATSTDVHEITVADRVASLDGEPKISNLAEGAMGTIDRPVILGATWENESPYTKLSGRYLHAEWYYATLYDSEHEALVNLVPALRGDTASQEAVFYDTVSGECFANAGTGTLAYDSSAETTNTVAVAAAATESLYNGRVAVWTGGGNPKDATDAQNWNVTDCGISAPGAIPGNGTKIADSSLAADADWSALAHTDTWIQPVEYVDVIKGVYVDTGIYPDNNTRVVMDVTVQSSEEYWFGAWNNGYKSGAYAVGNNGRRVYIGYGNDGGGKINALANGRCELDFSNGVFKVNGAVKYTMQSQNAFQVNYTLFLFGQDRGDADPHLTQQSAQNIRFHSCQIYDNNMLVRDYVPVTVGGVAKIYDRKNNAIVEFLKVNGTEVVNAGSVSGGRIGGDCAEIDGTIDLAGHKLTVGDLAGTGTITDSVGGGELHVSLPAGAVLENTSVTLAGSLKLVKEGAGTLIGAKAGQTYTGGTIVNGGWARSGVGDQPWGTAKSLITVADGAGFDWAGVASGTSSAYSFDIVGNGPGGKGAICNSVSNNGWNLSCLGDVSLSGDALIYGYGFFGFTYNGNDSIRHILTLNDHTLSIKMVGSSQSVRNIFAMRGVTTVGNGTIAFVENDGTGCVASFYRGACDLSSATLDLGDGYGINVEVVPTVGAYIDRRTKSSGESAGSSTKAMTVLDCFKPMTASLVRTVTLGDATHLSPVLDLSALDEPFVVPSANYSMSMASGATIKLKLGDRKGVSRTPIITWTGEKPSWVDNLRFSRGDSGLPYSITVKDDGIYAVSGLMIIFR